MTQIAPFSSDFHAGLLDANRAATGSAKLPSPLDLRPIGRTWVDRAMVGIEVAFATHLLQAWTAEPIVEAPIHRLNDQPCLEMP
jgi:hypothetical protein